jgi:hypothetical protein
MKSFNKFFTNGKISVSAFVFLSTIFTAFDVTAQYGGYGGGGYGGGGYGGYGRRGGMSQNIPQSEPKFSPPDPEKVADEETKWMKKNLKITDEQLPHIEDLNLKYASMRSDLYALLGDKPDNEKYAMIAPRIKKLYEDKDKELQAMIKPEQWEMYQKELLKKKKG